MKSRFVIFVIVFAMQLSACQPALQPVEPITKTPQFVSETHFNSDYIAAHRGKVFVEIPEAYELAHIAWAIARLDRANECQTFRETKYYQEVLRHFRPYRKHPLIQLLANEEDLFNAYYAFRTNSAAYLFDGDQLVHGGIYPSSWKPDIFTENLGLVEDFARQSGFREFYQQHQDYYAQEIADYNQKVHVSEMWDWLETHFGGRYDSYKILFSPLIGCSHNTQRFSDNGFSETVMFVSGPRILDGLHLDPEVEKGYLGRIVFTEIDHNYVGPVTERYSKRVNQAFSNLPVWNSQLDYAGYATPKSTFDEYMTWGVFILYLYDAYPTQAADQVAEISIRMMEDQRGFVRFGEFCQKLRQLYAAEGDGQRIENLYPAILDWAQTVNEQSKQ